MNSVRFALALLFASAAMAVAAHAEGPAADPPLGVAKVDLHWQTTAGKIDGLGGNYARERYGLFDGGDKAGLDSVGRATLSSLNPVHARVAIPLAQWAPQAGGAWARDDKAVVASFLLLQDFERRGVPVTASIWSMPDWAVADPSLKTGRTILADKYNDVVEALAQYLAAARERYGISVETMSFNAPDQGGDVKMAPAEIAAFIKLAGARFGQLALTPKWLIGDTSTAAALASYARPLLADPSLSSLLGPLAFQSWDCEQASDDDYRAIADLAKQAKKPVWCTALGYDAHLADAQPAPWTSWDHAMRVAEAYWKCFAQAGVSAADYWEYENDCPLAGGPDGSLSYPAFGVVHQLSEVLAPDAARIQAASDKPRLLVLATQLSDPKSLEIAAINTVGDGSIALSGLPGRSRLTVTRSGAASQDKTDDSTIGVNGHGEAMVAIAAHSVVTILVRQR
ncbi:MAG: hypothetical protein P4L33_16000 [Capsulimonadaceae bacterium]|nr:hypothetical protein [Capsulimonadaceae bacterium]